MDESFWSNPPSLQLNAWTGSNTVPALVDIEKLHGWLRRQSSPKTYIGERASGEINTLDWKSPEVGWGVVLPENKNVERAARATAIDACPAIQRLVAARGTARRGAPVLRWLPNESGIGKLLRYDKDGAEYPLELNSDPGIAPWQLPGYLLIFAPPDRIPWTFQYALNSACFAGRLWLQGQELDNYVDALVDDWSGSTCDMHAPLLWSVDHGEPDITWLMDRAISQPLSDAWANDKDNDCSRATRLFGPQATQERLITELTRTRPGLVVTTSHGMTGPLDNGLAMAAQLGLPVDVARSSLDLDALCEGWQPDGAIWYSHACCSAGSDKVSEYEGLFDPASDVGRILSGVARGCGASIAPLPQRLLGAKRPLRAFVGHVEPTFNWTLRDPDSGQPLTHSLRKALYGNLFREGPRRPIGWAMEAVFKDGGQLLYEWMRASAATNRSSPKSMARALYYQIAALDRLHTVILGDPTAALPAMRLAGGAARAAAPMQT